jgi:hypothetical protein
MVRGMSGDPIEPRSSELACPQCGASMVRRKRRLDRAEFWGCPTFPRCRGTRPLEAIDQVRPSDPGAVIEGATPWDDDSWRRHSAAGSSARAAFQRRAARHREKTRQNRPAILLRGAAFVVVGLVLATQQGTLPLAGWSLVAVGVLFTAASLWVAPSHVTAWSTGATGEERVGPLLETLQERGWFILHDRRVPGARENIDHLAIGPAGIVVVETKSYKGDIRMRDGVLRINGRRVEFFAQVERQIAAVERALETDKVVGVITVLRADFPWRSRPKSGRIQVVPLSELLLAVTTAPHVISRDDVARLARLGEQHLAPAVKEP